MKLKGPIRSIVTDWPWSEYGKMGAPFRVYIGTKKGMWLIGVKSQARDFDGYYRDKWRYITFHPRKRLKGDRHIEVWR